MKALFLKRYYAADNVFIGCGWRLKTGGSLLPRPLPRVSPRGRRRLININNSTRKQFVDYIIKNLFVNEVKAEFDEYLNIHVNNLLLAKLSCNASNRAATYVPFYLD